MMKEAGAMHTHVWFITEKDMGVTWEDAALCLLDSASLAASMSPSLQELPAMSFLAVAMVCQALMGMPEAKGRRRLLGGLCNHKLRADVHAWGLGVPQRLTLAAVHAGHEIMHAAAGRCNPQHALMREPAEDVQQALLW